MSQRYSKAYKEVLEILRYYLKEDEFSKIPKERIKYFERHADKNYEYRIDETKTLENQHISKEANCIMVSLYNEYFATDRKRKIIDEILKLNEIKEKYKK